MDMNISEIVFELDIASQYNFSAKTITVPMVCTGDAVITERQRIDSVTVKTYKLTPEIVEQIAGLIAEEKLTDEIGKEAPAADPERKVSVSHILTIRFEDGSEGIVKTGNLEELRKLLIGITGKAELIEEKEEYPTLKQCISTIHEEHGPVCGIEAGFSSSGMMAGSNEDITKLVEDIGDGKVRITITKRYGLDFKTISDTKEITSDIISKVQKISDRENLPAWYYASKDPKIPMDPSMIVYDYSSSHSVTVIYDDTKITGMKERRMIGHVAREQGGNEVSKMLIGLVNEAENASGIGISKPVAAPLFDATRMQPGMPGMAMCDPSKSTIQFPGIQPPSADGEWFCTECGTKNTGKFCCECGMKRP